MGGTITLTTDFGLADGYVAAMKGVILGINPDVKLVDISHSISAQNVAQGAFVLSTAYPYFPPKTVHVAVVDPGVGTERRAVILRTPAADFIAPDNGLLSHVIRQFVKVPPTADTGLQQVEIGKELEAVSLTEPRFWRSPVSPTFHGRDIFAPVAALLALGFPPINFGEAVTSLSMLPLPEPYRAPDGSLLGHVIHIDNFGNLITNIAENALPAVREAITILVADHVIPEISHTYADEKGLLALVGSSGHLEIAVNGGSAHTLLAAEIGSEVRIKQPPGGSK